MTTIQATEDATETTKRERVSSNSPPTNSEKQKEVDNCVTCSEPAVEDALEQSRVARPSSAQGVIACSISARAPDGLEQFIDPKRSTFTCGW